ncbi:MULTISPECIES: superoxide dismutase [Gemella]|uniref:Superoxide dismutase n=2 Tax=Gemella TaxID=1378 RepID=A0AAW6B483_9BACL|nr:superoxide dismutase [Gemella haemolysans]PMC48481.1 superoxide dismutase [Mn] [Streptococcus sp. UMB1385]MDB6186021.1 superoxide dismutase [Gemella haemolysans]MDB6214020.1 superoxide dismutase [Gemella haemolysans]MDU1526998.1 superoxide dismutase [Gemella haemolysans]MDU4713943.1 superoxide dismutase [Gemella haemolysans]
MTFKLPELPYGFDFLEPVIDAKTMEIHHDKHHAAYVNNLNAALEKHPEFEANCICGLLKNIDNVPADIRQAVINNGGGHHNHSLFWKSLTKADSSEFAGLVKEKVEAELGGYEEFVKSFSAAAATRFGSGWAWLALDKEGKLVVTSTANQDSPYLTGLTPILGLDVWEHAYYLNYQNRRPDYIKEFFRVVNWDFVNERLAKHLEKLGK